MFEAAELGRKVSKGEYKEREPELHTQLLDIQRELRAANLPVVIIVSGVEGAGKGQVVNCLTTWLDARGIQTTAFWDETDEERERPPFWRYWRQLPPRGVIGIMFGSWYTRPIISRVFDEIDEADFERQLNRILEFEHALTLDGMLIIKFWFHLSKEMQRKRLKKDVEEGKKSLGMSLVRKYTKHYDTFASVSERAIRTTDTGECPWYIVESGDPQYRNLTVGSTLLNSIRQRLDKPVVASASREHGGVLRPDIPTAKVTILDRVDLGKKIEGQKYRKSLGNYQKSLGNLAWKARLAKRHTIAVFEGWDAGGKGGAIRRVTASVDARLYRVISVAAPTDEEMAHQYLWRFWRHVPRAGYMTIYDRSWYGRVLVERVEGFARDEEWMRAYQEINDFEEQLVEHGAILLKFWIHLSPEEQLRRFKEREVTPWKKHKITEEDWRNREKWEQYKTAVNDMVVHTSTEYAPWSLISGNDKKYARVQVLKTFCDRLKKAL